MRPYPQQYATHWHHDPDVRPCVLCEAPATDVQIGGHTTVRDLPACWPCYRDDYDALVMLVDDLHVSDTRSPKRQGQVECPTCLSPACDCSRVTVLGDHWVPDHERRERA